MKTFAEVGVKCGLKNETLRRYILYMKQRWSSTEELECKTRYASEWANRFRTGVEYGASDSMGQTILRMIDGRKRGD